MIRKLTDAQYAFIMYLTSLTVENNRGTLATLRRGLTGDPFYDLRLHQFIARHIPDEDRDSRLGGTKEKTYYLVAALYANHPCVTQAGNFGDHLRAATVLREDREAAERRFTALLNIRLEDIHKPLRQALNMLSFQQQNVPVNWMNLFKDLLNWDDPEKSIQRDWANGFWKYEKPENAITEQSQSKK